MNAIVALALTGTGVLCYRYYNGDFFSWHPVLFTLTVGAMTLSVHIQKSSRSTYVHTALHLLALGASLGGFYVIYSLKAEKGKSHFWHASLETVSWHARLGGVAVVLLALASLSGLLQMFPKAASRADARNHSVFGRFLLALFFVALGTGFAKAHSTNLPAMAAFVAGVLVLCWGTLTRTGHAWLGRRRSCPKDA